MINKGITEPYRLLTSRAEFRLLLRHDNAMIRLSKYAEKYGLLNKNEKDKYYETLNEIKKIENYFNTTYVNPKDIEKFLQHEKSFFSVTIAAGSREIYNKIKRREIDAKELLKYMNKEFDKNVIEIVQTEIKYKGYIDKTINEVEKMLKLETKKIPMDIDYSRVPNIATEARQKFDKIRPLTIGQASRISGVNPADITMLLVYLKKEYNHE